MSSDVITYRICDPNHYWKGQLCQITKELDGGYVIVRILQLPADREISMKRTQLAPVGVPSVLS